MNKKYIVIINNTITEVQLEDFKKSLSSSFINIKGAQNYFLLIADENQKPKEIHAAIKKNLKDPFSFVIVGFDSWFGAINSDAFDWLKEKFPETEFL